MVYKSTYGEEKEKRKTPKMGGVGDIQQKLYSKNTKIKSYERQGFSKDDSELPSSWKQIKKAEKDVDLMEKPEKKSRKPLTLFTKLFITSGLFFMFSLAAAFLVFFYGQNEVTYEAVDLSVLGPNSVAGGEELSFDITIGNNNPISMVLTDVIVNYPRGTITADGQNLPLDKDLRSIELIRSGLSDTVKFDAIILGKEGETKDINIVFQYRVPDSDRIFFKERLYQVLVESSPVVVSSKHEKNYQTGDEMDIDIDITSNAKEPIDNLLLVIDFPFGFEFASSSIDGVTNESYVIDQLQPGESRQLSIRGTIVGQNGEQRTFRYALGAEDPERPGVIGAEFNSTESVLTIAKPPIDIDLALNGDSSSIYSARTSEDLRFSVNYNNTLLTKLVDVFLTARLEGLIYDNKTVDSPKGYYRSNNNTVNWSGAEITQLRGLESGDSGKASFQLRLLDTKDFAGIIKNPEMLVTFEAEATNFEQGGDEKKVSAATTKRIRVATDAFVNQDVFYSVGPLINSGPKQPTVGQETTYSVRWQIKNTTNDLKDVQVSAKLPPYVSFSKQVAPADQLVQFDARTRVVTWNVGEVVAGAGYSNPEREVYFTVSFEPSLDQINQSPVIIESAVLQAQDTFADVEIKADDLRQDIKLFDDPEYDREEGKVRG